MSPAFGLRCYRSCLGLGRRYVFSPAVKQFTTSFHQLDKGHSSNIQHDSLPQPPGEALNGQTVADGKLSEPSIRSDSVPGALELDRFRKVQLTNHPFSPAEQAKTSAQSRREKVKPRRPQRYTARDVGLFIDRKAYQFSPILLRDLCACPSCVDTSTQQKLFSTADIPSDIQARSMAQDANSITLLWDNDVAGFGQNHATVLTMPLLRILKNSGILPSARRTYTTSPRALWNAEEFRQLQDVEYDAYMRDNATLFHALQRLHTHGLLFLKNVPESEKSVSSIAERIGPVKNTFYGYTWDVRSVPQAKNVAYTSQDLGFHMDLLYMEQPPHLQFLHCIRSSSIGGASLFTDSFRAASALLENSYKQFGTLAFSETNFHYNHPSSDLYHQTRPVFEMSPPTQGGLTYEDVKRRLDAPKNGAHDRPSLKSRQRIMESIDSVAWSPPFQAPFSLRPQKGDGARPYPPHTSLSMKIDQWHDAAKAFSALVHQPEGIYERLMKPGECVVFDNRRVLHARRAFEVGDLGKERWLRGAYLDKDPFLSRLRVLGSKLGVEDGEEKLSQDGSPSGGMREDEAVTLDNSFQAASTH